MSGILQSLFASAAASFSSFNPSDITAHITLSNNNNTATYDSSFASGIGGRGIKSHSSGKWYFEITLTNASGQQQSGIAAAAYVISGSFAPGGADSLGANYDGGTGAITANSGTGVPASSLTTGDVVGIAVDVSNQLVYFSKNGTWQNSAVPSSGTNGINYVTTNPVFPTIHGAAFNGVFTLNTGGTAFQTAPPSGFSAWG